MSLANQAFFSFLFSILNSNLLLKIIFRVFVTAFGSIACVKLLPWRDIPEKACLDTKDTKLQIGLFQWNMIVYTIICHYICCWIVITVLFPISISPKSYSHVSNSRKSYASRNGGHDHFRVRKRSFRRISFERNGIFTRFNLPIVANGVRIPCMYFIWTVMSGRSIHKRKTWKYVTSLLIRDLTIYTSYPMIPKV